MPHNQCFNSIVHKNCLDENLLNSSETGSTSSLRRTLVAPILGITIWLRYQLSVSIPIESQVVFCPFVHLKCPLQSNLKLIPMNILCT